MSRELLPQLYNRVSLEELLWEDWCETRSHRGEVGEYGGGTQVKLSWVVCWDGVLVLTFFCILWRILWLLPRLLFCFLMEVQWILLSWCGQHTITMHSIFHKHKFGHWDTFVCFFSGFCSVSESFVHFYTVDSYQGHSMRDLCRSWLIPTDPCVTFLPAPMQQANKAVTDTNRDINSTHKTTVEPTNHFHRYE